MSPRPGFVLEVDRSTPPTLFWHGEGFRLERLPEGSRVLYAPEPVDAAGRPGGRHPPRACPSARGLRTPAGAAAAGMRLTIAFDDVSLPLPPMRRPDNRQLVIEQVLDFAAEAGVDDVVLICALALHRRMTEAELRHIVGDRVYDAFAAPRAPAAARRRGSRQLDPSRAHRSGRGRRDQQAGGDVGSPRLRQHQPGGHGRRPQVGGHGTGQLPEPAATTTTPGPCSRAGRSWTSTVPSCTRRTGGWDG